MKSPLIRALLTMLIPLSWSISIQGADTPAEPLPTTVFKNLAAGKEQTVILYGTSLTINGAWSNAVHDYFDKQFPGQATFFNNAKAGMDSNWGVANLQERVLSKNPDLVFIEFSMNDAAKKNNISLEKSAANLDTMIKALRSQNPRVDIILQTMDIAWDSPQTPQKKFGSERPHLNDYYDVYRKYAHDHGLPLVDNYPTWLKYMQDDPENYHKEVSDGIHPQSGPSLAVTWPAVEALLEKARAAAAKP